MNMLQMPCFFFRYRLVTVSKLHYQNLFNRVTFCILLKWQLFFFDKRAFFFEKPSIDCAHCTGQIKSNIIINIFSVKTLVTCYILLKLYSLLKKVWKNCQQMAPPYMFFIFLYLLTI